jgi:hypothetical protein
LIFWNFLVIFLDLWAFLQFFVWFVGFLFDFLLFLIDPTGPVTVHRVRSDPIFGRARPRSAAPDRARRCPLRRRRLPAPAASPPAHRRISADLSTRSTEPARLRPTPPRVRVTRAASSPISVTAAPPTTVLRLQLLLD